MSYLLDQVFPRLIRASEPLSLTSTLYFKKFSRCINTSSFLNQESPNQNYTVSKVYENRNPRNLEKLGLARKRLGWRFQAPRRDYYHKLVISRSVRHTEAWIEHFTGDTVLSASTKEWAIRNQLFSCNDLSACVNVGKVLAQRCLESGITSVFFDQTESGSSSSRVQLLIEEFKKANISLREPEMIQPEPSPGINYEGYNRYAEPNVYQENYQDI
ncbi:39S ribosomal protein L18, mitochondrial [Biomphalaria glabrata]|uniref:Large ribosomal subunit protein uL18m n=1 Tax=Biomphalaria glabrata TaxID=6526 RepID=A0A2C9LM71_BIOGL|nr:39S ribosomal protein L18, mitochondrial [Biomphalaria glabrata]